MLKKLTRPIENTSGYMRRLSEMTPKKQDISENHSITQDIGETFQQVESKILQSGSEKETPRSDANKPPSNHNTIIEDNSITKINQFEVETSTENSIQYRVPQDQAYAIDEYYHRADISNFPHDNECLQRVVPYTSDSSKSLRMNTIAFSVREICTWKYGVCVIILVTFILGSISLYVVGSINERVPKQSYRTSKIRSGIIKREISKQFDIDNLSSPQHKGLLWVSQLNETENQNIFDKYVLATLIFGLENKNGESILSTGMGDKCFWNWVSCDKNKTVTRITLPSHRFDGSIVKEITYFKELEYLDLSDNKLSIEIPTFLGELSSLQYLNFSKNKFKNVIPHELCRLSRLRTFRIQTNSITGTFPSCFWELDLLDILQYGNNFIKGTLPRKIGRLKNLRVLQCDKNRLSGTLPTEIGNLVHLEELLLDANTMDGTIPNEIWTLRNLVKLNLDQNRLYGTLPIEIGNLTSLETFEIGRNRLSGTLPTEIGYLRSLIYLQTEQNQFNGTIPKQIANVNKLIVFLSSRNKFCGSIPPIFGELHALKMVELGYNSISGSIPSEIGRAIKMEEMMIENNLLTGTIPSEIGKMKELRKIFLNVNSLKGTIPSELEQLSKLEELDISLNKFDGSIPKFCSKFRC